MNSIATERAEPVEAGSGAGIGARSAPAVGIRGISYHYDEAVPIDTIPELAANPKLLGKFKRSNHGHYTLSHVGILEQAIIAARKTLEKTGLGADDFDAVVIGTSELRDWDDYPENFAVDILKGLNMSQVQLIGVTLGGCVNYAGALRVARNLIVAEGYRNVLVIETNQVRGNTDRVTSSGFTGAAGYILSDGAVSFVVTTEAPEFKLLGMEQMTKVDPPGRKDLAAVIAKNTFCFRHVTERALAQAGITREQLEKVVFHNINLQVLFGLMEVIDVPLKKLFMSNVKKTGHMWGADNLIGLHDYCTEENPPQGARFLLVCQANTTYAAVVCEKL